MSPDEAEQLYAWAADVPHWVGGLSDHQILDAITQYDKDPKLVTWKASQKGVCYLQKRILRTSEKGFEEYDLRVWNLSTPEILQSASIQEEQIGPQDKLIYHRIKVVRDGKIIDKKHDVVIRVLDDESDSQRGTLLKGRKVNSLVSDLRLGDVFIVEFHKVRTFDSRNALDKLYFRYIQNLGTGFWLYGKYEFNLIQERSESICIRKKYFRDDKGNLIPDEGEVVKKGDVFNFEKLHHFNEVSQARFSPYFEIATVATWEEIVTHVHSLYDDLLSNINALRIGETLERQLSSATDKEDKVRMLIEYVQDQIVYLFDAEVMHAHIPQPAQEVLDRRSGDCKAKSLILVRLLKSIDVEAHVILINYEFDRYIRESLPSPFVFNHAIVKAVVNGKEYFIDPTWSNRSGLLEYRGQPFFSTYLQIDGKTGLSSKSEDVPAMISVEENAQIELTGDKGKIDLQITYRGMSADISRQNFRVNNKEQMVRGITAMMKERLQYQNNKEDKEFFANTVYEIVNDDKLKNELRVTYKADLLQPLQKSEKYYIFRYYYSFDDNGILNISNEDAHINSFMAFPAMRSVHIKSRRLFVWWNKITKRNLDIDNKYFRFSNRKSNRFFRANAVTKFSPKTYTEVSRGDLQGLRDEILKINDSNNGTALVYFANIGGWILATWRYVFIAAWVIALLVGAISSGSH